MSEADLIRAWTDPEYRESLSAQDRAAIPVNPAGPSPLGNTAAEAVVGGSTEHIFTIGCCGGLTTDFGLCSLFCGTGTDCYVSENTLCLQTGNWCCR